MDKVKLLGRKSKEGKYAALSSTDEDDVESPSLAHVPSISSLGPTNTTLPKDSLHAPPPATYINSIPPVTPVTTGQFLEVVDSVRIAISKGIYPVRISQGSSGSYFCKNSQGEIVGVFKPKNEEPYGHLNPKWTKWIHKNLFPCCFGRSCIIPNLGYISEAAASYLDRRLQLNVCPRTEVVSLASPSFYYSAADRHNYRNGIPLPNKMGSFQLFLKGYKDATSFFKNGYDQVYSRIEGGNDGSMSPTAGVSDGSSRSLMASSSPEHPLNWSSDTQRHFQLGFERLVILDYMIRNTDRGSDNWMVRFNGDLPAPAAAAGATFQDKGKQRASSTVVNADDLFLAKSDTSPFSGTSGGPGAGEAGMTRDMDKSVPINVAVIDNGLAFPYKHPDRWRSYPYGWSFLPISRLPFTDSTRDLVLHLLTSQEWWAETLAGLERLFRLDVDFSEGMWRRQKAVIRGQGYNLVEALRRGGLGGGDGGSPLGLLQRPVVAVFDEDVDANEEGRTQRILRKVTQRFETFTREQPCFSWC